MEMVAGVQGMEEEWRRKTVMGVDENERKRRGRLQAWV